MTAEALYRRLMEQGAGDVFDRHAFACAVALAAAERHLPLAVSLGLAGPALRALFDAYFPEESELLAGLGEDPGEDELEEPDLRALLVEHGSRGAREEEWLAAIVARRSLGANHLWQDLGLASRDDLSRLLLRHFRPLAVRNSGDMKWKKFFYRALCERDGALVCKAPNCAVCNDVSLCFGGEAGEPLTRLQDAHRR
ncbi:MAG: nitrogen fixation protein NifQ [Rhodospirillales bacterium]|jgi:nitrogen fixation protein NifQ|nr:nitrogen fixation protein NifQ [Rhodospirillales bacterium]